MEKTPRSEIKTFSRDSRGRVLKIMASIDHDRMGNAAYVHMTYPNEWPEDPLEWKRHLHNFRRELNRHIPGMCAVWRLEPQKREAPHFHLLVWGGWVHMKWLAKTWYRIVGSGDEKNLRAGTSVTAMKSRRGAMWYTAKYLAKVEKGGEKQVFDLPVGRYWGVWNKERLLADRQTGEITESGAVRIVRVIRKYYESKNRRKGRKKQKKEERQKISEMELRGAWVMIPREASEKLLRAYNVEEERLLF